MEEKVACLSFLILKRIYEIHLQEMPPKGKYMSEYILSISWNWRTVSEWNGSGAIFGVKELSEIERCQGLHNCKLIKHNWVNFVLCNYTSGTVFEGGNTWKTIKTPHYRLPRHPLHSGCHYDSRPPGPHSWAWLPGLLFLTTPHSPSQGSFMWGHASNSA